MKLSTMPEPRFSNREIKQMFELQGDQIKNVHEDVKAVLEQTTKTNGRVGKLENWQGFIKGGLAVLTAIVVPMAFLIIKYLLDK